MLRLQEAGHAGAELLQGDGGAIAVQNLEAESEQVAEEAVGHVLGVRCRPTLEVADRLRSKLQPVVELVKQTALAHARLAGNRHDARFARFRHIAEGVLQHS